jgi:methylglutaconyl-CoA hydratase
LADRSDSDPADETSRSMVAVLQRLMHSPRPTVAVVRGPARAGGIGLMAACDLVAVAPEVTFAFTEVRIGVAPAIISVPIVRRVSPAHLTAPFLTGEMFDAAHAVEIGLVNAVGDPDDIARRWCDAMLAAAPGAVAATKSLLFTVPGQPLAEAFADMAELSARLFASGEGREGMAAFTQRRAPRWAQEGR